MLTIDYVALSAGIPLLDAYLNKNGSFRHGVNFAVAGCTALPNECLAGKKGIFNASTNFSLGSQLDWMAAPSIKHVRLPKKHKSSLFMVGEIGGNDYNYAFFQGKTREELQSLVLDVVQAIKDAAKKVITYGAPRLIIPGNFPIGCLPIYLTAFQTNDTNAYDGLHCLKDLNNFAVYHNNHLLQAIDELKREHPHVSIAYGDYYNAYLWVLRNAQCLGYDPKLVQKACCWIGGDYHFSVVKICGAPLVSVCQNPITHLSWD